MKLEEALGQGDPSKLRELSEEDMTRLFWKMRGLRKQVERDAAFWSSTNENLKAAYEKLDEQERELQRAYNVIREDLDVAEQVQRALLPKASPEMFREFDIAVYHKQLHQVGGDYYDYFRTREGRQAIGVFDISGHGASAALIMSFLKAQFMHALAYADTPKAIVERVNASCYEYLREIRRYATVNFVVFHADRLRYVSGGGYGLLLRGGQSYAFAKIDPFIGLRQRPFQEFELPFGHGDLLALYTDGMVEAQDTAGKDYSVGRLNTLIQQNKDRGVDEIAQKCVSDYQGFRTEDSDDITLIVLRRRAK